LCLSQPFARFAPATPAMTDDTIPPFAFPSVARKKITADFDGGRLTSDGGDSLIDGKHDRRYPYPGHSFVPCDALPIRPGLTCGSGAIGPHSIVLKTRRSQAGEAVLFDGRLPAEEFVDGKRVTATSLLK